MIIESLNGIKVKKKDAEKIRKILINKKILNEEYKLNKGKEFIFFPLKSFNKEDLLSYQVIQRNFEKKKIIPNSYKDQLCLHDDLKKLLPSSYDIIGSIALIKLPDQLLAFKEDIGKKIIEIHKNIQTVCLSKPVSGEFRTRNLEIIAGKESTITNHKEYGLDFLLDVEKTYFSPRLANERRRVTKKIRTGEVVVDMFAGIAPFSIMIAKYANPKIVISIDKNKNAVFYAKENIKINKVLDKVEVINDDAKNIKKILKKRNIEVDRIIMNLPFSAIQFFPIVLNIFSSTCFIHYYDILKEDVIDNRIEELKNIAKKNSCLLKDLTVNKIKAYAPREFYIGIDITAKKKK